MNKQLFSLANFFIVGVMAYIFIFVTNRVLAASRAPNLQAGS